MGPDWVGVRNASAQQTVRAGDKETLNVVARFDQLLAFCGMELSRHLGVHVHQRLSRGERDNSVLRVQNQAQLLATTGRLEGSLLVPNAAAPIDIAVDLRANRVDCSATLGAPTDRRAQARVTWLLRQLANAPTNLLVMATAARARDNGRSHQLIALRDDPKQLVDNPKADLRTFTVTLSQAAGTKRGQGAGSFVGSVTSLVSLFYAEVGQYLNSWSAPAPKVAAPQSETSDGTTPIADTTDDQSHDPLPTPTAVAVVPAYPPSEARIPPSAGSPASRF